MFYVKGRVPLHLRHELFDHFDGMTWHAEDPEQLGRLPELSLETIAGRPWLCWPEPTRAFEFFGATENHAIKVVHLDSNRVPTPLRLRGIHIDLLDRPDFFRTVGDQLVQMDVKALPDLTSIHLRSRTVDRGKFDSKYWASGSSSNYLTLPEGADIDQVRALAREWAGDWPRG